MLVPELLLTPIKIRLFGPKMAKFGPKYAFLVILGQILPFFAHFVQCPTKNNVNKVPRWVFRYVGNKTFDFSSKKKDFLPKNDQIWPKSGIFGQFGPGLFSALLMGRLVVVARGLYLARHLFTLFIKANLNKLGCVKRTIVITIDTCMYIIIFQPALLYLCNDALHSHPSEASPECLRYWCIEEVHMPLAHLISSREIVGRIGV